ncbi:unnamed protein product [marine sediment metagenome]|uniref:Uncharacterized protein n=1 Tax=marine sediment metagenome TaxID=412755 RepID=X0T0H3_9ZZZZ
MENVKILQAQSGEELFLQKEYQNLHQKKEVVVSYQQVPYFSENSLRKKLFRH